MAAAIRRLMSAAQMSGARVVGAHGEEFGHLQDILVEVASSQIVYGIVSYGGFAGIGTKQFAVPWDVLKYNAGHEAYVLNIPEEKLKDAPGFDRANLQDIADSRWAEPVHKYFGSKASWYEGEDTTAETSTAAGPMPTLPDLPDSDRRAVSPIEHTSEQDKAVGDLSPLPKDSSAAAANRE